MIPLKDSVQSRTFPAVTVCFICLNTLCFLYEYLLGPNLEAFILQFGFIPARYYALQATNWMDFTRFLPILSSMFLHANLLHLISNMWILWIFGDNVEDSMGHRRYFFYYLLCGFVAAFFHTVVQHTSTLPMVGASGAISGVLGGYFLLHPRARILTLIPIFFFFSVVEVSAYFFLIIWFLLQFIQGAAQFITIGSLSGGGVAWWAHIGGFAAGMFLIPFFRQKKRMERARRLTF